MKTLFLTQIIGFIFALNFWGTAHAAGGIVCETAYGEKVLNIDADHVVFSKETSELGRSISSVEMVRTEKRHHGFDKILNLQGLKHRIHIDDAEHFSDVNDYLVITSPKGHEMTYPLSCHKS